jgi:hypothetical protein
MLGGQLDPIEVAIAQVKKIQTELRFTWQWLKAIAWVQLFGFAGIILAILYRSGLWHG